jgi:hypothetical protein
MDSIDRVEVLGVLMGAAVKPTPAGPIDVPGSRASFSAVFVASV